MTAIPSVAAGANTSGPPVGKKETTDHKPGGFARAIGIFSRPGVAFWCTFGLILVLGGFLRFWRLGFQSFWCDETATTIRISGSFQFIFKMLQGQGFPPGWYILLWSWVHFLHGVCHVAWGRIFTASVLRFPGALLGWLNVPAAYFLARQFAGRRTSLLIMLLVAINPFFVYYSRDLKMYSAFYLFVTLNMALFLRWQGGRHFPWGVLYILSLMAMVGLDFMGLFLLPIQLSWLLFKRRFRAWDIPIWLLAAGGAGYFTAWWYTRKTGWFQGMLYHHTAGNLQWVSWFNGMNYKAVLGLPTVDLLGFLWPSSMPTPRMISWFELGPLYSRHLATRTVPLISQIEFVAAWALFGVLILGLVPWRRLTRAGREKLKLEAAERAAARGAGRWWHVMLWLALPMIYFGLASLPAKDPWSLFPHFVFWLPRYMGFLAIAWVLWLGAALARLPLKYFRWSVIAAAVLLMTASSLTNTLICRSEPWRFVNQVAVKYFNPKAPGDMFIAYSKTNHSFDDPAISFLQLRHVRILPSGNVWGLNPRQYADFPPYTLLNDWSIAWLKTINTVRRNPQIRTLVLADRFGDVRRGRLSTAAISRRLGRGWKLAAIKRFRWYFQWRYYFFSPWRVRVWQRVSLRPGKNGQAALRKGQSG